MPLTLSIRNADRLDNGSPLSLVLDRRGAVIGRAPTTDWCLPDPNRHISSRHCEVQFRAGGYQMVDVSTNGTFLLGQPARLDGPHAIAPGDVFVIGGFEVLAIIDGQSGSAAHAAPPPPKEWTGWENSGAAAPAAPITSPSSWDARPTGSAISGSGPMSQSWAAPKSESASTNGGWGAPPAAVATPPADTAASSGWASTSSPAAPGSSAGWGSGPSAAPENSGTSAWTTPTQSATPASGWSSSIPDQAPPAGGDDIWGKIAASNVVDWARGGFGAPPAPPPAGIIPAAASVSTTPPVPGGFPSPAPATPIVQAPPVAAAENAAGARPFLGAAGISVDQLKQPVDAAMTQAGDVMRRIVAGMVVMLEARARAKSQLGAAGTSLEFDGNNPLKFARTPEQALAQLLNPTERGFMPADRAIEDAFRDLQAHQVATLKAMQGALRATLDRFSPNAIRARVEDKGLLQKVLPGARDAALWKAYEREFSGVAQGSDEAFMDVFAKEFRAAYEDQARKK